MSRRYELLIFDWDGTLMDSAERIVRCFQGAACDLGLTGLTDAAIRKTIGLGVAEALSQLLPGATAAQRQAFTQRYREYFLHLDDTPTPLFAGVAAGLRGLKARGYQLAVATGKSRAGLDAAMAVSATRGLFCASRCADETRSKPHPQMLEELLAVTGVAAHQAVMVGDTTYDMEMAERLAMDRVAVAYGVHTADELRAYGPQALVANFTELCAWLS